MRGNHNRIKSYYEHLIQHNHVDILFLAEKQENKVFLGENIYFYKDFLPKIPKSVKIEQPYNISSKVKYEYKLAFDEFLRRAENNYNFIIIPYIWNSYLIDTKPNTDAKFICDTHDSFSERTKSLEENGYVFTSACTTEQEKFCLRNFDYIMAISDNEKEVFEGMGYKSVFTSKYFYLPKQNKTKLGIIGGSSIHNIHALNWFMDNIFPYLNNEYLLYICGDLAKNKDVQNKYKGEKGIVLYEYIWNIEDFYNMVDICINPVQMGSGLKIKNIEAISYCKPIITSTLGAQGMSQEIDMGLIFVADTLSEWVSTLSMMKDEYFYNDSNSFFRINLFKNPTLCGSYGLIKPNGQTIIRNGEYDIMSIYKHLKDRIWNKFFR